jgi:SAM-dependent methyltransferase
MSIRKRKYKSYESYLAHQAQKLSREIETRKRFSPDRFSHNVKSFKLRIGLFKQYIKGPKVICLGARLGEEVVAFRELGFPETIGIDLNPGPDNPYVVKEDFHNTSFADGRFNTVYTNSLDHSWDIASFAKEVHRILSPDGVLILELNHLLDQKKSERRKLLKSSSKYESLMYDNVHDVVKDMAGFSFRISIAGKYRRMIVVLDRSST